MSRRSTGSTVVVNSSPTTRRQSSRLKQEQEQKEEQKAAVVEKEEEEKSSATVTVEKPVAEKGKRGRKPSAATLAKRAAEAASTTTTPAPTKKTAVITETETVAPLETTTTETVAPSETSMAVDEEEKTQTNGDDKVAEEKKKKPQTEDETEKKEEEIIVRRTTEVVESRQAENGTGEAHQEEAEAEEEESAEASAALKEIRHVRRSLKNGSGSGGAQNGHHHSDDDDEDDDDEYTDDDGGMGGGDDELMDSSLDHKENESGLIADPDSSLNVTSGGAGGQPGGTPKSKKKEDHEKLRRRLPVSVKELIDYHSSNGKSIKEIVAKVNVVCRQDEKVSYGYVQKYLYRKKLEATTAKKARYYRKKYGFVYRRMRRKPVLTDTHRQSRIQWCESHIGDHFDQDVFIGKTSLKPFLASLNQLKGQPPDPNQPRQQTTLHLWGAISRKGASPLQIFDGALTTAMYLEILLENVVPFIAENFPNGHRFHQDNNPKHSAKLSQEFLESTGINWVKSPPRSHDLNPIELVWTDLIQNVSKRLPKTIGQVVVAVKDYWKTLTPEKCSEFIDKLVDIVPKVLEKQGEWVSLS